MIWREWQYWMIICLVLVSAWEYARSDLRNATVEYRRILPGARLLEVPQSREFDALELDLDVGIVGSFYWDNRIHLIADSAQVRWVGWQYEVGAGPWHGVQVFAQHHSQHELDGTHPFSRFPFENSVGFRWRIYP